MKEKIAKLAKENGELKQQLSNKNGRQNKASDWRVAMITLIVYVVFFVMLKPWGF